MPVSRATARMLRPSPKIQPRIFIAVSITNTCSSSVPKRTDVNNAGGSVLDDHNPPKWVSFACRFTVLSLALPGLAEGLARRRAGPDGQILGHAGESQRIGP